MAVLTYSIALSVLLFGYLIYKSNQNTLTVLSVLLILPATKYLIGYIILAPFHSVSPKQYEEVNTIKKDGDTLYTNLVFTSPDKIMNLSYLLIRGNQILGFCENKKSNINYMQDYLKNRLSESKLSYQVKIVSDYTQFIKAVQNAKAELGKDREMDQLKALILSLLV